jgi:subtilisin-like proprotein convertase family protein
MKLRIIKAVTMLVLMAAGLNPARGQTNTSTFSFAVMKTVPDGNASGLADIQVLAGTMGTIADVNVTLHLTDGFDGDFYAYLEHDGVLVVLLNRPGRTSTNPFGYSESGLSITLDDQAAHNIHWYNTAAPSFNGSQLLGTWQPDGRNVDPDTVDETISPTTWLGLFHDQTSNGRWTLFVSDLSNGEESVLESWELQITTIPEPQTASLLLLAGSLIVIWRRLPCRVLPGDSTATVLT